MKNKKTKGILVVLIMIIMMSASTSVFAASPKMQVVKNSENEYMIYIEDNLNNAFEFALSNDKNAKKEDLVFHDSAKDTEKDNANNIAYVDSKLYEECFSKNTYIWARADEENYIIEAELLDLNSAMTENDVQIANNLTKIIKVDATQTYEKTTEAANGDKSTKTVGKMIIKEDGKNSYQLAKVTETGDIAEFAKIVDEIVNGKIKDDYYSKLEITNKLSSLYKKLLPSKNDKNWKVASNNEIIQPEEAKEKDKYIVWIKNENNGDTKIDFQFLTCFEDYKPETVTKQKVVSELPITSDDPTLFIVLGALVITFVVVLIIRFAIGRKKKN